jgi:hypothetical protein
MSDFGLPAALSRLGSLPTNRPPADVPLSERLLRALGRVPQPVGQFDPSQYNDLGTQARAVAGLAPTAYDQSLVGNALPLAQSQSAQNFLSSNPAPQMAVHDYLQTPNHAQVPTPVRGPNYNEMNAHLATGLLGMAGSQNQGQLAPELAARGQYLDERTHSDALNQYQMALNQNNTAYNDSMNSRQAQLGYQDHVDSVNAANAQAAYQHAAQLAQSGGTTQGIQAQNTGLAGLQSQAHAYAQGEAGLNSSAQLIQASLAHDALARQDYGTRLKQALDTSHNEAENRQLIGSATENTARGGYFNAMAKSEGVQSDIKHQMLPFQLRALDQDYNTTNLMTPAKIDEMRAQADAARMGANTAQQNANTLRYNALTGRMELDQKGNDGIKTSEQNAAIRLTDKMVKPYQDDVDAARAEQEQAGKFQGAMYMHLMAADPKFADSLDKGATNPDGTPGPGSRERGEAQRKMKAVVDANNLAIQKLAHAEARLSEARKGAAGQYSTILNSNKVLGGKGKGGSTLPGFATTPNNGNAPADPLGILSGR